MPAYKIEITGDQEGWAIWHISEHEAALRQMALPEECPEEITSSPKRMEWLTGRILVRKLVEAAGLGYAGITKDEFGKPFLKGHPGHLSLSHSYPFVAAQISRLHDVGIDIEQPKDKLLRIAHRVLSKQEEEDAGKDIIKNCVYWCAKEALYKIYGKRSLSFSRNLHVNPFHLDGKGRLTGKISSDSVDQLVTLGYSVETAFVLVYTLPKNS